MGVNPDVLYSALLHDLRDVLPSEVIASLARGDDVAPWPDITTAQFASLSLGKSFLKKFMDNPLPEAEKAAIEEFLVQNQRARDFRFQVKPGMHPFVLDAYAEARSLFGSWLHSNEGPIVSARRLIDGIAAGPGAAQLAAGTSFYQKFFAGPLAASSQEVLRTWKSVLGLMPAWESAEEIRAAQFGDVKLVESVLILLVPKRVDIARTIAEECAINMALEKGVADVFLDVLQRQLGINLAHQWRHNQRLAQIGSSSDSMATLDLAGASNGISCTFFDDFAPPEIRWWCNHLRSASGRLPDGRVVPLGMVSTMGNGFTFALQSLIFSAIVQGVYRVLNIPFKRADRPDANFAVFGDDIIVVKRAYKLLASTLEYCGFEVNLTKSFSYGDFRESCGGDFFRGCLVRPVYCRSLASEQDRTSLLNQLNRWTAGVGVCLPLVCGYLARSVRSIPVVPPWEADTAGLHAPLAVARELGVTYVGPKGSYAYERFLNQSLHIDLKAGGVESGKGQLVCQVDRASSGRRNRFKPVFYNPLGVLQAALKGTLRGGKFAIQRTSRYRRQLAYTSFWDYTESWQADRFASDPVLGRWARRLEEHLRISVSASTSLTGSTVFEMLRTAGTAGHVVARIGWSSDLEVAVRLNLRE